MAYTHVPVLLDAYFDPFTDNMWDLTFPPRRYARSCDGRHDNRRGERRPCNPKEYSDATSLKVSLHVGHYTPEEISLKVEDGTLLVNGKHFNEGENGFESSEFQRKYILPVDADTDTLKSRITNDGVLQIEANKKEIAKETVEESNTEFKVKIPLVGFKPENITVKLNDRNLVIHAEEKAENEGSNGSHYHFKQMTRHFALPKDVDASLMKTELMKDGTLTVKAPRDPALMPQERVLPIETAKDADMS